MNKKFLHIVHLVTFLVALQILNIGCFVQEFEPIASSSLTPEVNIINTFDEYIAEVVLHQEDAVPELKGHSKKDIQIHKHSVFKLINLPKISLTSTCRYNFPVRLSQFFKTYNHQFFADTKLQPPKAAV